MRAKILSAGVKNLKEFGYTTVDTENILTDYVYRKFFRTMLEGKMEDAPNNHEVQKECTKLIAEIDAYKEPA